MWWCGDDDDGRSSSSSWFLTTTGRDSKDKKLPPLSGEAVGWVLHIAYRLCYYFGFMTTLKFAKK